jgi:hypothetical protein
LVKPGVASRHGLVKSCLDRGSPQTVGGGQGQNETVTRVIEHGAFKEHVSYQNLLMGGAGKDEP